MLFSQTSISRFKATSQLVMIKVSLELIMIIDLTDLRSKAVTYKSDFE